MANSYSTNQKFTKQVTGENSGTWGTLTNENWDKLDAKLGNATDVSDTSGTKTLSETEERVMQVNATGTLVGNLTIEFSGRKGMWIVKNATSGAFSVTCKVTGQTGITVSQGYHALIYCNGTDIVKAMEEISSANFATTTGNAWAAEATVADSGTPAIGAAASYRVRADGTTTVTGFDTVAAGIWRVVRWNGVRQLTHNASSFILRGAANRTTAAGDISMFRSEGSGNWREEFASRANGKAIVGPASTDITDSTAVGRSMLTAADIAAQLGLISVGIAAQTEKTAIVAGDKLLIADSESSNAAKMVQTKNLPPDRKANYVEKTSNYTMADGDQGGAFGMNNASSRSFTIPANATVPFDVGTYFSFHRIGAGAVAVAAAVGVTILNPFAGLNLRAQYSSGGILKLATNTWLLSGDFSA